MKTLIKDHALTSNYESSWIERNAERKSAFKDLSIQVAYDSAAGDPLDGTLEIFVTNGEGVQTKLGTVTIDAAANDTDAVKFVDAGLSDGFKYKFTKNNLTTVSITIVYSYS